jgi:hypothetical protein
MTFSSTRRNSRYGEQRSGRPEPHLIGAAAVARSCRLWALGSGASLPEPRCGPSPFHASRKRFVLASSSSGWLKPFIENEFSDGPLTAIDYVDGDRTIRAYDARILSSVCNVWLRAREAGALQKQQLAKAQQAEILIRGLAQTAIIALIDEATGYEKVRPQGALQAYLELVIRKDLAAWAKRFPDEFYENIYRLRGWKWPGMQKNRFSVVARYTRDLVYERLGPGVLQELERKSPRNEKGNRPNKLHQWLTEDIGHPMLAQHMHTLLMFQRLAIRSGYGWARFVQTVNQVRPKRGTTLELPLVPESSGD